MKRSVTVLVSHVQEDDCYPTNWIAQQIRWSRPNTKLLPIRTMVNKPVTLTWDDGEPEPIEPILVIGRDNLQVSNKLNEVIAAVNALREAKR